MTAPGGRVLPPDLARRLDELLASGDAEGYLELLRETDDRPAPRVTAPGTPVDYDDPARLRRERDEARDLAERLQAEVELLRRAARATAGSRLPEPGLLAYDDGPPPMGTGERLIALALVGPWIACAAGWTAVVGIAEAVRWARR